MAKKDKKSSDDRNYKVIKKFGYLNSDKKKILAKISWYDKDAKYDIRKCWDKEGELMIGTGISVSRKELKELRDLIDKVLDADEEDEEDEQIDLEAVLRLRVDLEPHYLLRRPCGLTRLRRGRGRKARGLHRQGLRLAGPYRPLRALQVADDHGDVAGIHPLHRVGDELLYLGL